MHIRDGDYGGLTADVRLVPVVMTYHEYTGRSKTQVCLTKSQVCLSTNRFVHLHVNSSAIRRSSLCYRHIPAPSSQHFDALLHSYQWSQQRFHQFFKSRSSDFCLVRSRLNWERSCWRECDNSEGDVLVNANLVMVCYISESCI